MVTKIFVIKKTNNKMGNPVYTIFIPGSSGKIKGLRKLKTPQQYSFSSYNIKSYLESYSFKGKKIEIYDKYGDRV